MTRVLIADDDEPTREILRAILEDEKHTVLEATNGLEALTVLRHSMPIVAIVDLQMPALDGLDLIRALTVDDGCPHALILSTARTLPLPAEQMAVIQAANATLLAKPFDLDELLAAVLEASLSIGETVALR